MTSVRPFLLIGAGTLARIRETIAPVAVGWAADWISGVVLPAVSCQQVDDLTPTVDLAEHAWRRIDTAPGYSLWANSAASEIVRCWLFETPCHAAGSDGKSRLAGECAERAFDDLLRRLAEALGLDAKTGFGPIDRQIESPDFTRAGAGTVLVTVAIGTAALEFLLPADCITGFLNVDTTSDADCRDSLSPLSEGLAAQEVGLKVWLGEVEVTLGMLREITVGDVIRLPTLLDEAVGVSTDSGDVLFKSYLGVIDGQLAIELSGRSSATENGK